MNQMSIDVDQRRSIIALVNKVCVPQLIVKRASHIKVLCKRVEQHRRSAVFLITR